VLIVRLVVACLQVGAVLFVAACSSLVGSQLAARIDKRGSLVSTCASSLGSYALPKALLVIDYNPATAAALTVNVQRRADNLHQYCLEFERSPLATESVHVRYAKDNSASATQFLQALYSSSIDETGTIIRKIIEKTIDALSRFPNRADDADATAATALHYEIDPFDAESIAQVNAALRSRNLCLVLGDYTFNTASTVPSAYCDDPVVVGAQAPSPELAIARARHTFVPRASGGVYYRPRANYELAIYRRSAPGKPWLISETRQFALENLSPVVLLGLDRAAFAKAQVAFLFEDGTLNQVCIVKGSEAVGLIRIPIDLIYGIVSLPAKAFDAEIELATGQIDLFNKIDLLLKTQDEYAAYLRLKADNPGATLPAALQPGNNPTVKQLPISGKGVKTITYDSSIDSATLSDVTLASGNAVCTQAEG
jgi:hypothetical protein